MTCINKLMSNAPRAIRLLLSGDIFDYQSENVANGLSYKWYNNYFDWMPVHYIKQWELKWSKSVRNQTFFDFAELYKHTMYVNAVWAPI